MHFNGDKRYNDFSSFIKSNFSGRVQKITLDVGFTCPNRDGSKGIGGCTYCNNNSFNPNYCKPEKPVSQQLEEGISFFSKKYADQKYLAYFQAYTNTYADIELIKELYLEALAHPEVVGLVIGTRPDCISKELIDFLSDLSQNYFISLELGVESTLDRTLLAVNRCHTYAETESAFEMCRDKGIHLGAHIILGLPGESREDILNHAKALSELPIETLKIHHLQIIKHTMMAVQYKANPSDFHLFELDEYVDLITEFITLLRPDIVIERFSSQAPHNLLVAPNWNGVKNYEIVSRVDKKLAEQNLFQGNSYQN